jgi:hypothetical protein
MRKLGAWALTLTTSLACGGGGPGARGPERALPAYSGHAQDLFDDGIDAAAVGLTLGSVAPLTGGQTARAAPRSDNLLRERTQVGDAVVRARVRTVTSKDEDRGRTWFIGLHTLERLAGTGPLESDFTVEIGPSAASSGLLRAYESHLIGSTFVAYVREFEHPSAAKAAAGAPPPPAEGDLHFHIARDDKDEVDAVRAAVLLDRVR